METLIFKNTLSPIHWYNTGARIRATILYDYFSIRRSFKVCIGISLRAGLSAVCAMHERERQL